MAASKSLRFDLTANDKTKTAFASVNRSLTGITKSLGGMKSLIGGAFAVGGLTAFAKSSLNAADSIAKTADAVGLSTDALQEYTFVADKAGVSQQTLESGLDAFTKRVGEAREGTGALSTFLGKYNEELQASVVNAGSTEEALDLIFQAMANTSDASERAALSAAAFGRTAGLDMVNLVRDGTGSLEAMRQQASDLGLVMDEELLRGAENANDQLSILGDVVMVNLQKVLIALAPHIASLAQFLGTAIPQAIDLAGQAFGAIGETIAAATQQFRDLAQSVEDTVAGIGDFFSTMGDSVTGAVEETTDSVLDFFQDMSDKLVGQSIVPDMVDLIAAEFGRLEGDAMVDPARRANDALLDTFDDGLGRVGDLITGFVEQGKVDFGSLADFALDLLPQILGGFTGGGGGGGLASLFGGGGGGGFSIGSLFGFQHGGAGRVGGSGGPDSQLFMARATPGEPFAFGGAALAGIGGGGEGRGVTVYNIDARGSEAGVERKIEQVMIRMVPGIQRAAVAESVVAVESLANAGGSFSKSVGRRR